MKLESLTLIEVITTEINYIQNQLSSDGGEVEISYGVLSVEGGATVKGDDTKSVIIVHASPSIKGINESIEGDAFRLNLKLRLLYSYPAVDSLQQDFIQKNQWYFENAVKTHFKINAEQILAQTPINSVKLPFN